MITFMYRWRIPLSLHEEFERDWENLSKQAQNGTGLISAVLSCTIDQDHVAISVWPSNEAYQKWATALSDHPYRQKWRAYKVSSDTLNPVVQLKAARTRA